MQDQVELNGRERNIPANTGHNIIYIYIYKRVVYLFHWHEVGIRHLPDFLFDKVVPIYGSAFTLKHLMSYAYNLHCCRQVLNINVIITSHFGCCLGSERTGEAEIV